MTQGPDKSGRRSAADANVLFEFRQIGNSVKVTAVDAETGLEVSIIGPANALPTDLQRLATSKLARAKARNPH